MVSFFGYAVSATEGFVAWLLSGDGGIIPLAVESLDD
jgi:hypothetical protein